MKGINERVLLCATWLLLLALSAWVAPLTAASEVALLPASTYRSPMLALEFDAARASCHFADWDAAKQSLRQALHWDFLFLLLYPALIAVSCLMAGRYWATRKAVPMGLTLVVMGLQLLAGTLDAVENMALLRVLDGSDTALWAPVARWCAITKFTLVFLGAGYALLGGGAALAAALMRR
jgi:hypothetical protein